MPELLTPPGVNGEGEDEAKVSETERPASPVTTFEQQIAEKEAEFAQLSNAEVDAKLLEILGEHSLIREEIQALTGQLDGVSMKAYTFAVTNLRGEGSVTLSTRETARRYLSQLNELGQKMAYLNQRSQRVHEDGAASKIAAGEAPRVDTITFADILDSGLFTSSSMRDVRQQLAERGLEESALAGDHADILSERGIGLVMAVKAVAKQKVHPESHTSQSMAGFVGGAKRKLEELLGK